MSQSDYIRYKKLKCQLSEVNNESTKIPNVLDAGKYILYKEYSLENTIINNKVSNTRMIDNSKYHIIFGMVKPIIKNNDNTVAVPFLLCSNTDDRTYRSKVQPLYSDQKPVVSHLYSNIGFGINDKTKRMRWIKKYPIKYCINCANI